MINIHINGKPQTLDQPGSLIDVLKGLEVNPFAVVVEHNERVIKRKDLAGASVQEGDKIEIIHFIGGGSTEEEPKEEIKEDLKDEAKEEPKQEAGKETKEKGKKEPKKATKKKTKKRTKKKASGPTSKAKNLVILHPVVPWWEQD